MHKNEEDKLHEMMIVHKSNTYVRPHMHKKKSESFMVLNGKVDVVIFHKNGNVKNIIEMGSPSSGHYFYLKIPAGTYHSMIFHSKKTVYQEAVLGPFSAGDTIFAKWSPNKEMVKIGNSFLNKSVQTNIS